MQTSTKQLDLGLDEDRVDDIRESQAPYKMPALLSRVSGFKATSLKYIEARAESAKSMNEIKYIMSFDDLKQIDRSNIKLKI